jgi:hypothetical protein
LMAFWSTKKKFLLSNSFSVRFFLSLQFIMIENCSEASCVMKLKPEL